MAHNTVKSFGYWLFALGLCLIISSYINIEEGLRYWAGIFFLFMGCMFLGFENE